MVSYLLDLVGNGPRRKLDRECMPRIGETLYDSCQKYRVVDIEHNVSLYEGDRLPLVIAKRVEDVSEESE